MTELQKVQLALFFSSTFIVACSHLKVPKEGKAASVRDVQFYCGASLLIVLATLVTIEAIMSITGS